MRYLLSAVVSCLLFPGLSQASPITETYVVSGSGFLDARGSLPSSIHQITGSFTVTFDPSQSYADTTDGLIINSLTGVSPDSQLGFTYDSGILGIGGLEGGVASIESNTNDFVLFLDVTDPSAPEYLNCGVQGLDCGSLTGNSHVAAFGYTDSTDSAFFIAPLADTSVSVTPEPSSMLLCGSGLLGAAGVLRRRRCTQA